MFSWHSLWNVLTLFLASAQRRDLFSPLHSTCSLPSSVPCLLHLIPHHCFFYFISKMLLIKKKKKKKKFSQEESLKCVTFIENPLCPPGHITALNSTWHPRFKGIEALKDTAKTESTSSADWKIIRVSDAGRLGTVASLRRPYTHLIQHSGFGGALAHYITSLNSLCISCVLLISIIFWGVNSGFGTHTPSRSLTVFFLL